jgi:hypothetical protein
MIFFQLLPSSNAVAGNEVIDFEKKRKKKVNCLFLLIGSKKKKRIDRYCIDFLLDNFTCEKNLNQYIYLFSHLIFRFSFFFFSSSSCLFQIELSKYKKTMTNVTACH